MPDLDLSLARIVLRPLREGLAAADIWNDRLREVGVEDAVGEHDGFLPGQA